MKVRLTPELAYIIGLWKTRKTKEGIGVEGGPELLSAFVKGSLDAKLTTSNKLLTEEDKAYFYHSAYRRFFQEVLERENEAFKHKNEFCASFLAGLFDSRGGYSHDGKTVYLSHADKIDEFVVLNAGFKAKLIKNKMIILDKSDFLSFISKYRKVSVAGE